jgi:hypothetical protein
MSSTIIPIRLIQPDWAGVLRMLVESGAPVTRENFIDMNWVGEPPEAWDGECEEQLPPWLREWVCWDADEPSADILPFARP